MEGRDRVIDYVAEKYGRDSVLADHQPTAPMAAKAVVRDVGRVLGHPYGFVDKIAKLVPSSSASRSTRRSRTARSCASATSRKKRSAS